MTTIEKNRLTELSNKVKLTEKQKIELSILETKALKFKEELKKKRAESFYGIHCLNNHAKAKAEAKTLGYCIKFYLGTAHTENLISGVMFDYISKVNTDNELYKRANNETRRTKKGFLTPFYFLQWCTKQVNPTAKK
jgi:hypothetical protein